MAILEKTEMIVNAAGRFVPEISEWSLADCLTWASAGISPSAEKRRLRSALLRTIPPTATSASQTSRPLCANAACAMAWSSPRIIIFATATALRSWRSKLRRLIGRERSDLVPQRILPSQKSAIALMEAGVIDHIEGSMNGPLGDYCTQGKMRGMGVLRSHGGRWQAIQDGEVHIDIAVIAAPTADPFGNCDGSHGKSACGSLGFALADSIYADHVIVVTDNLVPFPCVPWQIQGNNVDYVVEVDSIGDPAKIVSGTTQITRSPDRLRIAEFIARFLRDAGIMRNGFSFQAGSGGIALAFVSYLKRMMKQAGVKARFVRGGSTKYLVELLEEGSHRLHPRRTNF